MGCCPPHTDFIVEAAIAFGGQVEGHGGEGNSRNRIENRIRAMQQRFDLGQVGSWINQFQASGLHAE